MPKLRRARPCSQGGATVIEYVMVATCIAVVALLAFDAIGEKTRSRIESVASTLNES